MFNEKEIQVIMTKNESLKMMKMTDYCSTCHCEGARKHDCCNSVFRVEKNLDCHAHFRSLAMTGKKKAAFTLAETLITLTILGVVAAITVPMLINKQMEAANRTKLKKAMAAYEKALNQMIIDNDIKGTITAVEGFKIGQCDISSSYFKTVEILKNDKCRFKTADKVGYDITDITHPIFFLSDDYKTTDLETASTGLRALAKDTDNNDVFGGVGEIKDGIVRINDKGAATGDNATILNKSYAFMNKDGSSSITSGGGGVQEPVDPSRACSDNTKNDEGNYVSCTQRYTNLQAAAVSDDVKRELSTNSEADGWMIYFNGSLDGNDDNYIIRDEQGRIKKLKNSIGQVYYIEYDDNNVISKIDYYAEPGGVYNDSDQYVCGYAYDSSTSFNPSDSNCTITPY